jgi:hypothetical protein
VSYISIPDFKYGTDRRRNRVSGVPGTLWSLKNGHITRGGDIERAKKFVSKYSLPANTFGMAKIRRQLYVFGSASPPTMPNGVLYQQLTAPNTPSMVRVLDAKVFASKLYVIAEFADGNIFHYYNGARITDWDALSTNNSDFTTLADYFEEKLNASSVVTAQSFGQTLLITSRTPGTAFSISQSTVDRGALNDQTITLSTVTANVAEVLEVRSTGTVTVTGGTSAPGANQLTQVTVNGVQLMVLPVNWTLSNSATASAVATEINNRTATHNYTAVAVGAVITIKAAPGTGATPNTFTVIASVAGNVTASKTDMAGGVTYVAPVAQVSKAVLGGTYQSTDEFTITIAGTNYTATGKASGAGVSVFVSKRRVWSVAGNLLNGCALNTPTDWSSAAASTGFVSINTSNESDGTERLVGITNYQDLAAVFSRNDIRLYSLNTDATLIAFSTALSNTGTRAGRSPVAYGSNDVFYLDPTGARSIRAHAATNAAYMADVGTPIDPFVRDYVNTLPSDTVARAIGAIEPVDGRFWLVLGARIFVLSFFPSSKINAWSYYEPGFSFSDIVRVGEQIYARAADVVYLYGGDNGTTYPNANEQICTIEMPFLTAGKPAHEKDLKGYDASLTNDWLVEILPDPNDETKKVTVGHISRNTFHLPDIGLPVRTSSFAFNLTCAAAGAATISSITAHFTGEEPAQ